MRTEAAVDHTGLEVMTREECERALQGGVVGRVAFLNAGQPIILPVNFVWDGEEVIFRTTVGEKLDAAMKEAPAAFEIDEWDELYRTGWSVVVRGRMEEVFDLDELEAVKRLPVRPFAQAVARPYYVRIVPDEITGRRIR